MHLFKLILPMLSVGVALATECSNGLSGLEKGGVCCPVECGTCGGTGCGSRSGLTKYDCCTSNILEDNNLCSAAKEAPCVIDPETPADPTCSNGVAKGDICCSAGCGYCGGSGCAGRGGLSGDECCTSTIAAANKSCDDQSAPCVMSGDSAGGATTGTATTGTATTGTTTTTTASTSGTSSVASTATSCGGVAKGAYCCNAGCGTCGGSGCGTRGEGCCTSDAALHMCSVTGMSPCEMDSASTTTTATTTDTTTTTTTDTTSGTHSAVSTATSCGGVTKGAYCCNAGCGTCGGSGCGTRGEGCCTSDAATSLCSVTGMSPCLMDSASTTTTTTTTDTTTDTTTTTDATSGISAADATATSCDGVSKGAYCCNAGCGTCGGTGCGGRGEGCCTSDAALSLCSVTGKSPCMMESAIPTTTTDATDATDTVDATTDTTGGTTPVASTATSCGGVASGYYCCNAGCGTCGGTGCGTRGDGCCASDAALSLCSATGMSPCLMDTTSTTTTTTTDTTTTTTDTSSGSVASTATSCGGVATGAYCCNAGCGTCGGDGCGTRGEGCCTSDAAANLCSATGMSPCLMDSGSTSTTTTTTTSYTSTCNDYSKGDVTIEIKTNVETDAKKNGGKNYIRGGGCATLTDIYTAQGGENDDGPLFVLDSNDNVVGGSPTGYWLLMRDIHVEEDSLLQVHGFEAGGDAEVLRIQSTGSNDYYEIRGHGGSLSFVHTKVTSWDTDDKKVNTNSNKERSFIRCVSEELADNPDTCEGHAVNHMGECRMDIINSEMGEMGYFAAESYGLSWKVRGYCSEDPNPELFERTRVRGDILDSEIYGMYYGHYSFGHDGGKWMRNKMHDNVQYGFDPHDDSDNLEIAYNEVWGNGNHGIIASKRCNNVKIHHNTVYDGGDGAVGIFLHRSSDDCEVYENTVYDMEDAGMAIMESMNAHIYKNTFTNVKYGIRLSVGASNNLVEENKFYECDQYGIYTYQGSDDPEASEDWDGLLLDNTFHDNIVEGGVKIQKSEGIIFTANEFFEHQSGEEYRFEDCEDVVWTDNKVPDGICLKGDKNTDYFKTYNDLPELC